MSDQEFVGLLRERMKEGALEVCQEVVRCYATQSSLLYGLRSGTVGRADSFTRALTVHGDYFVNKQLLDGEPRDRWRRTKPEFFLPPK